MDKGIKKISLQSKTSIKRVTKVTRGGRQFSFSCLALVNVRSKDKKNENIKEGVGYARKKGKEAISALRKSVRKAQKKLVNYYSSPVSTISRDVVSKYKNIKVVLYPASPGSGVRAGSILGDLFKMLGIKNIGAKIISSHRSRKNKSNILRAAFRALDKLAEKKNNFSQI